MAKEEKVLLAHGGGGTLMHDLIKSTIAERLKNPVLDKLDDSAVLENQKGRIAFTTDSYVVKPLFFNGGDIGKLAVCGTVNDLAVQGARPYAISLAFIIEEGFAISDLERILKSIASAANDACVFVATGDFKVVERGGADGIFINTSGIGFIDDGLNISSENARPGDVVIVNGFIADHGVSILCKRKGLEFETDIESDCAPLNGLVGDTLSVSKDIRCMKDATRGGLAAVLNEIAQSSDVGIEIDEASISIRKGTLAACEMLGLDPLVVANEGKVVVVCPEQDSEKVLKAMKNHKYGKHAAIIGRLAENRKTGVFLKTAIGGSRIIDMPYGELLPRIC